MHVQLDTDAINIFNSVKLLHNATTVPFNETLLHERLGRPIDCKI